MIKVGSKIQSKYGTEVMQIVDMECVDHTPTFEAKWVREDGSLSEGSLYIYGSQIESYEEV